MIGTCVLQPRHAGRDAQRRKRPAQSSVMTTSLAKLGNFVGTQRSVRMPAPGLSHMASAMSPTPRGNLVDAAFAVAVVGISTVLLLYCTLVVRPRSVAKSRKRDLADEESAPLITPLLPRSSSMPNRSYDSADDPQQPSQLELPQKTQARERSALLDHAKLIAMWLVNLHHMLLFFPARLSKLGVAAPSPGYVTFCDIMNRTHMPIFFFCSGMVAKDSLTTTQLRVAVIQLLLPGFLFDTYDWFLKHPLTQWFTGTAIASGWGIGSSLFENRRTCAAH